MQAIYANAQQQPKKAHIHNPQRRQPAAGRKRSTQSSKLKKWVQMQSLLNKMIIKMSTDVRMPHACTYQGAPKGKKKRRTYLPTFFEIF
jgi:hypothetical protein